MVLSTGVPSLADKRYFLSQMSSDASWKGMASTSLCSSLTTLFMEGYLSPEVLRTAFFKTPKSEPEKRDDPSLQCLQISDLLAAAVRRPPFPLPGSPTTRCRETQHLVLGSRA